jgi:hypothetical protein
MAEESSKVSNPAAQHNKPQDINPEYLPCGKMSIKGHILDSVKGLLL